MKCETCFFERFTECRRFPPTDKGFPVVSGNSWCGEWRIKDHAVEERKVEKSDLGEHQGIDALRAATEASDSHSDGQGGQEKAEETRQVKHRGWPKGKPRK